MNKSLKIYSQVIQACFILTEFSVTVKSTKGLNISRVSGVFTVPRDGVYLITFSYQGENDPGEVTYVYIYKNGAQMVETRHNTYYSSGGSGKVWFTGGRTVYQRLEAGDTLTLQTGRVDGDMWHIMFCVEFINN